MRYYILAKLIPLIYIFAGLIVCATVVHFMDIIGGLGATQTERVILTFVLYAALWKSEL